MMTDVSDGPCAIRSIQSPKVAVTVLSPNPPPELDAPARSGEIDFTSESMEEAKKKAESGPKAALNRARTNINTKRRRDASVYLATCQNEPIDSLKPPDGGMKREASEEMEGWGACRELVSLLSVRSAPDGSSFNLLES